MGAIDRLKDMLVGLSDRLDHMLRRRQEKNEDDGEESEESGESGQDAEE